MQTIIIKNIDSFNLTHIFECGQCFRWKKISNNNYIGVVEKCVLNVQKTIENSIKIDCYTNSDKLTEQELFEFCSNYFDLRRDYKKIKNQLYKIDKTMIKTVNNGEGIRILNQDLWETIISYIISANNNIPRIKGIIERISQKYGDEILVNGNKYYTFPTPEQLSKASVADLKALGLGFRDKRVYETTRMIINKNVDLTKLSEKSTQELQEILQKLPGVGPKVADCILLFSTLKRTEVFPVDVWIRRVMNELYIHNENENKVSKKQIQSIAKEKFGQLAGIAQQYLYYSQIREEEWD